jgi:V/A-type H+-transporting ATPase subunit I
MWGTPGGAEVDPSGLLAVVVPLLFGYMFPDVGHGLVLVLFAAVFSKRWPKIRFLLPCGVSAMFFGLMFGDVFGFDDLIPALWLKPLDQPLVVLAVPLLFGVALMLLGLVLAGVAAAWRGELRAWLWLDGAVLLLYAAALLGLFMPEAAWLAALAVLQYFVGTLVIERDPRALPGALGQLLLSAFELAMNTLSFVRVGAFALGHAALSLAIMTLASGVEHPLAVALVLIIGNGFSLVLEGLVVYVQTTRLVLFEFFTRFLREEGRLFRPLRR